MEGVRAMRICIGIDPGQDGAYAAINEESGTQETHHWDDAGFIEFARNIIKGSLVKVACLERTAASPQMGVVSAHKFGKSAGFIEGVLRSFEIPYQLILPMTWKKEFGLIVKGVKLGDKADKGKMSIAVCEKLFPEVNLYRTPKCKTKHDGMAEALLMAEYARRKL